uniref:Putative ovule protein n=1 Tax=Solanum chacoense TaxID=4108 RepID=A0A0V0H6X4_SOLCH
MLYEQQVDQLENFHLPPFDQMLLLEGANTTTNTIIDVLETAAATREVTLKAPTIEDIDKTIVAVSEQMEIIKMLQEAIFSHICAAADFVESELQATNNKKEGPNNALEICWLDIVQKLLQMCSMKCYGKLVGLPMK